MRVLLDENLPHDLIDALVGHSVSTVQGLGWAGTKNGALLKRAGGLIDVLVTIDSNLEHQQNVSVLPFGIVVVGAPTSPAAFLSHGTGVRIPVPVPTSEPANFHLLLRVFCEWSELSAKLCSVGT